MSGGSVAARFAGYQAVVAVWGLDKDLGLPLALDAAFHLLEAPGPALGFDGEITVEGEAAGR